MQIQISIPQLFYDLIARILPGFLVLFVLYLVLNNTGINISNIPSVASKDFVASLFGGIGYAIICYFMGWILNAFTFGSYKSVIKNEHSKNISDKALNEMYHKIRLINSSEGFRIIKLRAEARMFEASRTGMIIVLLVVSILLFLQLLGIKPINDMNILNWIIRFILPIILGIGFRISEKKAWHNYFGNIPITYSLITSKLNYFPIEQTEDKSNEK